MQNIYTGVQVIGIHVTRIYVDRFDARFTGQDNGLTTLSLSHDILCASVNDISLLRLVHL